MGPGKYDDDCSAVRYATNAKGVLLIVFDGDEGSGFSAQLAPDLIAAVPAILRQVASEIEESTP